MLVIRFVRTGRKNSSFFKLVAAEKARAVQKKPVAELGWYNPHVDGGKGEFKFDAETVKKFIANGAQVSQAVARKLAKEGVKEAGKFIEQRATKPKKEAPKKEEPKEEVAEGKPVEDATKEAPTAEENTDKAEDSAKKEEPVAEEGEKTE